MMIANTPPSPLQELEVDTLLCLTVASSAIFVPSLVFHRPLYECTVFPNLTMCFSGGSDVLVCAINQTYEAR